MIVHRYYLVDRRTGEWYGLYLMSVHRYRMAKRLLLNRGLARSIGLYLGDGCDPDISITGGYRTLKRDIEKIIENIVKSY